MPNPLADCGGERRAGGARCDGNAGRNDCAVDGRVGAHVRNRLGAGGAACGEEGKSGGGGGKAAGSVGLGSTGDGDLGVGPALHVPVLCGGGWLGGACGI